MKRSLFILLLVLTQSLPALPQEIPPIQVAAAAEEPEQPVEVPVAEGLRNVVLLSLGLAAVLSLVVIETISCDDSPGGECGPGGFGPTSTR